MYALGFIGTDGHPHEWIWETREECERDQERLSKVGATDFVIVSLRDEPNY